MGWVKSLCQFRRLMRHTDHVRSLRKNFKNRRVADMIIDHAWTESGPVHAHSFQQTTHRHDAWRRWRNIYQNWACKLPRRLADFPHGKLIFCTKCLRTTSSAVSKKGCNFIWKEVNVELESGEQQTAEQVFNAAYRIETFKWENKDFSLFQLWL